MIYFIRQNKSGGGAEIYLKRLTENLGIEYKIIYSKFPKWLPSWLRVILFNISVCLNKKNRFYFSLDRIVCPDIYRAGDGVHKKFLKIEKKSKLNPLHYVYLFIEKRMFKNAKIIIANSNMVKNEIIEEYNIDKNKIVVIYNGVALKEKVDFSDIKKEFNLKNEKIILYVGSGFKRKGVKEALDIVSKLKGNFKFIVIGKEKKISFYKEYAKKLKIDNKVIFTGPRSDVDKFYSMSDIFLFPTRYEPFSNVVLEALNFENVVFTTKNNGASEILPKEWIIDEEVVSKIQELLDNEDKLKKLKKEAKKLSKDFSIERNVKKTVEVINEVIN